MRGGCGDEPNQLTLALTVSRIEAAPTLPSANPCLAPACKQVHGAAGLLDQLPGVAPGVADSLQADGSAVAEELNVAWAAHEITADFMAQTLAWIDSKGGALEGQSSSVAEL